MNMGMFSYVAMCSCASYLFLTFGNQHREEAKQGDASSCSTIFSLCMLVCQKMKSSSKQQASTTQGAGNVRH